MTDIQYDFTGWIKLGTNSEEDNIVFIMVDPQIEPRSGYYEPLAETLSKIMDRKKVSVRYWIADRECTKEQAEYQYLHVLFGDCKSEYQLVYSEITGYLWTDEFCKVGGHDLINELRSYAGKYLILEVAVHSEAGVDHAK